MRPIHRSRRGVTLIEIAIVIAIIGVLAGIGAGLLTDMIPTWRTRQAALEFQTAVNQARTLAVADATQYRILFTATDGDVSDGGANEGEYWVQKGDASSDSTEWDTLPVEMTELKVLEGEGYVNIAEGEEDSLPQVSIRNFDPELLGDGATANAIFFGPRGDIENAPDDFACDITGDGKSDGFVCVTFVNKRKAASGADDSWTVIISRAGMSRLQHSDAGTVGYSAGTGSTTTNDGAGTGYVGPNEDAEDTGSILPT